MDSQFSNDGAYYAVLAPDGKLRIWETATSLLKQEFTPALHLNQPCTCLHWIQILSNQSPWRKRKRTSVSESENNCISLGTKSGSILIYSPTESKVRTTLGLNDGSVSSIECLAWAPHTGLISCGNQHISRWNISDGTVKCKWKQYKKENATRALIVPNKAHLVVASRYIHLWDIDTQELLHTYVGHSSDVHLLSYVPHGIKASDGYFISAAKGDRFLSCWSLKTSSLEKTPIAKFVMEDVVSYVSLATNNDGLMTMSATLRNGVVHMYQQILNGKCDKPVKPQLTIQIAAENKQNQAVNQVPIFGSFLNNDGTIFIGYGAHHLMMFEKVTPSTYEKLQCLIRIDPRKLKLKDSVASKTVTPETENNVEYLTPNAGSGHTTKRKTENDNYEVPMEKRLENLILNKPEENSAVPKANNVAHLLLQGLHSKDKQILQTVFVNKDVTTIRNTVRRLPVQVLPVLIKELTTLIQGKTLWSQCGAVWLKHVVQAHAGQLIANPSLTDLIGPTLGAVQSRLSLLPPLSRLRGRLDLLVSQISSSTEDPIEQAAFIYQDDDSSESSSECNLDMNVLSDSDDQWDENSSNESSNISDVEMSIIE